MLRWLQLEPETVACSALPSPLLHHLERHDVDFVLVRVNMGGQNDVVTLVSFYSIRVHDGPALAVLVAHKHFAVIANLALDVNRFRSGLHAVIPHIVLSPSD